MVHNGPVCYRAVKFRLWYTRTMKVTVTKSRSDTLCPKHTPEGPLLACRYHQHSFTGTQLANNVINIMSSYVGPCHHVAERHWVADEDGLLMWR